jgi:hypothetical protein
MIAGEEILHVYISEFQNKLAWKFGISVSSLCVGV